MASSKKLKDYQDKVSALLNEDQAEKLFSQISKDSSLSDDEKQALNISAQTKINEIKQAEHDLAVANGDKEGAAKAIQTGDPVQKDEKGKVIPSSRPLLSEDERDDEPKQKPIHVPANCKKKIVGEEELQDLQKKGLLVGCRPVFNGKMPAVKFTAIIKLAVFLFAVMLGAMSPVMAAGIQNDDSNVLTDFARTKGMRVNSNGDIVPVTTATNSIGDADEMFSAGYFSGDVTFNSSLLTNGRAGGASTMSSSSTFLSAAGISYSVINKRVGGGGGLDSNGRGSTLPNGTQGQVITFLITALQSGGSWVLTPINGWNWNKAVFDAVEDSLTMLYETSLGWINLNNTSVTITRNQLP